MPRSEKENLVGARTLRRRLADASRTLGLAVLAAATASWMVLDAVRDPYDPSLEGTRRYGHNYDGALRDGLVATLIELAFLYAVLRPWKKRGYPWLRILVALLFLVPWTLLSAVLTMHQGSITVIHLLWLVAAVLALAVALVVSAWRAATQSFRPR